MSLSPFKTFSPGEILTASDLNSSFSHITTNGESLGWPATVAKDLDGQSLILDSGGTSKFQAGTNNILTLTLNATSLFVWNGATASVVNGVTTTAAITGAGPTISATGSDTNIDLLLQGKGTGKVRLLNQDSNSVDISRFDTNKVLVQPGGAAPGIAVVIQGKGLGQVKLGDAELAWPDADGTAGKALVTDGAGSLSFGYSAVPGTIIAYGGIGAPTGYLACDGSNVSRTTYAALFTAISTTWGAGDGSTTFALPDLRRRTLVGVGGTGTGTLGSAVGNTGGAETVAQVAHVHNYTPSGTVTLTSSNATTTGGATSFVSPGAVSLAGANANTATDSGATLNIIQPSAVVGYYIKT